MLAIGMNYGARRDGMGTGAVEMAVNGGVEVVREGDMEIIRVDCLHIASRILSKH